MWGSRTNLKSLKFHEYKRFANVRSMNGYSEQEVAAILNQTIAHYCTSTDEFIEDKHIPKKVTKAGIPPHNYVALATQFWKKIKSPDPLSKIPINALHLLKINTVDSFKTQ